MSCNVISVLPSIKTGFIKVLSRDCCQLYFYHCRGKSSRPRTSRRIRWYWDNLLTITNYIFCVVLAITSKMTHIKITKVTSIDLTIHIFHTTRFYIIFTCLNLWLTKANYAKTCIKVLIIWWYRNKCQGSCLATFINGLRIISRHSSCVDVIATKIKVLEYYSGWPSDIVLLDTSEYMDLLIVRHLEF